MPLACGASPKSRILSAHLYVGSRPLRDGGLTAQLDPPQSFPALVAGANNPSFSCGAPMHKCGESQDVTELDPDWQVVRHVQQVGLYVSTKPRKCKRQKGFLEKACRPQRKYSSYTFVQ